MNNSKKRVLLVFLHSQSSILIVPLAPVGELKFICGNVCGLGGVCAPSIRVTSITSFLEKHNSDFSASSLRLHYFYFEIPFRKKCSQAVIPNISYDFRQKAVFLFIGFVDA